MILDVASMQATTMSLSGGLLAFFIYNIYQSVLSIIYGLINESFFLSV